MAPDVGTTNLVIVGVDGTPSSVNALRWAAHQAELTGATLRVVTTWAFPATVGWTPPYPEDFDPEADARAVQKDTIAEALGEDPNIPLELVVVEGHASATLIEMSHEASLLVVGCRGHGAVAGLLVGSVSEHVVCHASCPVVVVRH
ncbi:MAG TPA: universal stress protein [Acidimicrobiales bacterium]|nr:universal stress protein [Acidimicrobiales bacterium]